MSQEKKVQKPFTWDDLSKAFGALPEDKRKEQVYISMGDEPEAIEISSLLTVSEDIYISNDDDMEDCGTLEDLKYIHGADFNETNYKLITPKGTAFLWDGN